MNRGGRSPVPGIASRGRRRGTEDRGQGRQAGPGQGDRLGAVHRGGDRQGGEARRWLRWVGQGVARPHNCTISMFPVP
jgi:hypothetical protein